MRMKKVMMMMVALLCCIGAMAQGNQASEEAYLQFLYQYMPMPDRADYSRDFYRENVQLSLQARQEMAWGKTIPEREFKHFVLPVRVNNENLDMSRREFYRELKPRVKNLSLKDAILEVNHWCHEKVTYRPSDGRTSSPLASMKTAYGRCGEESTFLVAALRSVGIPARQVYTPRWAHTDDNHAWVEAYADGKWYFLGACEPEPVLNLGWFNESASRGMLMHTKAFGHYDGPEEVMSETNCYTEINVIDNYAPTQKLTVTVVDAEGRFVPDATVEFKVYNYAEFYTVGKKQTDAMGCASLTAGKGDMMAWVSKDGHWTMQKVSFAEGRDVTIVLPLNGQQTSSTAKQDFDLVPPPADPTLPYVSPEQREENDRRMAEEDAIRQAYERTMPNEDWRGNYHTIQQFLAEAPNKEMAEKLLSVISKKDLRDISLEVLKDNEERVTNTDDIFCRYVMNPRVELEWLTPYKQFFRQKMGKINNIDKLIKWTKKNIRIVDGQNPSGLRQQPMSVYRDRVTDRLGRNIFFVSVARSMGMPARINEVNGKLQYYATDRKEWTDVVLDKKGKKKEEGVGTKDGRLLLKYTEAAYIDDPKYYIHFTISKIENGKSKLMTFPEDATYKSLFEKGVDLEAGHYMLITGTRMADGKVLAHTEQFDIRGGETTTLPFTMREDKNDIQVIGALNAEDLYLPKGGQQPQSLLSTTGRGFYIIGIIAPNHEPTNHTLRDISTYKEQFEQWGRSIILLTENEKDASRFNYAEFSGLPSTVVWGSDIDGKIKQEIVEGMKLKSQSLPLFLVCDTFNRVVYIQQGYTINIGEHLLKVTKKLK